MDYGQRVGRVFDASPGGDGLRMRRGGNGLRRTEGPDRGWAERLFGPRRRR
jgi:hypothetical protein